MITLHLIARISPGHFIVGFLLFFAALILTPGVNAQRPSVSEMQAQIDALTHPYDEPVAQVRTALDLLPVFQDAIVRRYNETGVPPDNRVQAGFTPNDYDTQTNFIRGVEIIDGSVVFTFGNDADPTLTDTTLSFTPYVSADDSVWWRCGSEPVVAGMSQMGNTYYPSTIPASAQPDPCILKAYAGVLDESVKQQVLEPFAILQRFKDAVVAAGVFWGSVSQPIPPGNRAEAGLSYDASDTVGRYFTSLDIDDGVITVQYGNQANAIIDGRELSWTPYESNDGTIVWRCGNAEQVPGTELMGYSASGNVAQYYSATIQELFLPLECRH